MGGEEDEYANKNENERLQLGVTAPCRSEVMR